MASEVLIRLPAVSAVVGGVLLMGFLAAAFISRWEGEPRAAGVLGILAPLIALPFFFPLLGTDGQGEALAVLLLSGSGLLAAALFIPWKGRGELSWGDPVPGVDERTIMFSRAELQPGTERFTEYYGAHPEHQAPDANWRKEPGLLAPGSLYYHQQLFPAADASFWTIEMLRPFVEGGGHTAGNGGDAKPGMKLGGERGHSRMDEAAPQDPQKMARFLKEWALKMGAHSAGIAEVKDYHLYSHVGRGEEYGDPVTLDHTHALALTVEMDKELVDRAPAGPAALETAYQYLRGGVMAVQIADLIRRLGYRARAHVDGNYRVICPLVARDAGLGELGRMGILMTPNLGPRVRLAVVTTDLPLAVDGPRPDSTMLGFCLRCRKCANVCPSQAISLAPPKPDGNGVVRWAIDSEACFAVWTRFGTDCGRCMSVCPYSHADNGMHAFVRWGIRNNVLFRRGAIWMDDLVYGRTPAPKPELTWTDFSESGGPEMRSSS